MNSPVTHTERRSSPRFPVSVGAVVYYNSLMLPGCEISNISSDGAFVTTDGQFLPDQAMIDLGLAGMDVNGVPQRLTVQVVRSTGEGVGVRLASSDPATVRRLVEMLYSLNV